jgi:hypothetical protein
MATKQTANIGCVGDFGNPSGTGISSVAVPFDAVTLADAVTDASAFFAAIKAAQLTACNQSDLGLTFVSAALADKPAADVNVDRVLLATWREKSVAAIHRISIPGVPVSSTGISNEAAGERLNDTGKAALAAAIEAITGITAGTVVVLQGKVFQKK